MADADYPALGFDPLPGNPEVALRLAADARVFGERMTTQAEVLRQVSRPQGWTGEAAEAFTAGLKDLPDDLEICGKAFTGMAGALDQFHQRFVAAKARAAALEERARTARGDHDRALAVYEQPVFLPVGAPPVVRDRRPVDAAERDVDDVVREAARLQDDFDDEVSDLVRTIYSLSQHAPREPLFDKLTRWAGDVLGATPIGAQLRAAHALINAAPQLFADLADFLGSVSNVLGIAALPLFIVPGLGQFIAFAALATAGTAALLKTSLFVGRAVDANGKAYVSGGNLRDAWVDTAFNAAGFGATAKAAQAVKVARGVSGAAGRAGFARELAANLRVDAGAAWSDARRLGALRQELGTRGATEWLAGLSRRHWDQLVPGAKGWVIGGLATDLQGPTYTGEGIAGYKSVVALPGDLLALLTDDADVPDLRANVPSGTPGYSVLSTPGTGPRPVMGD